MIERAMNAMKESVVKRFWLISDLQQSIPENATACMTAGVEDFKTLNLACNGICYLGDVVEGNRLECLNEMTQMQIEKLASFDKPVFTLGHYGFPGANRGNELLGRMLPLPDNVRMRIYGHAHIGDGQWAGRDLYRKIACVDNQQIPQVNVASLENRRGSAVRSAIFEYYEDDTVGIYFRNHTEHQWDEMYMQRTMQAPPVRTEAK